MLSTAGAYNFNFSGISIYIGAQSDAITKARALLKDKLGEDAPVFVPHVTVVYNIPGVDAANAEAKLRELCSRRGDIKPFEMKIEPDRFQGGWKFGDYEPFNMRFFQLEYEGSSGGSLDTIYRAVNELFPGTKSSSSTGSFMPHASVLYLNHGDERFTESDCKELLAAVPELLTSSVQVDHLLLYRTEGKPDEWELLAEIALGN
jgi:2'-5' RNA ligase